MNIFSVLYLICDISIYMYASLEDEIWVNYSADDV